MRTLASISTSCGGFEPTLSAIHLTETPLGQRTGPLDRTVKSGCVDPSMDRRALSLTLVAVVDQLSLLKLVAARLEAAGVAYLVTGSMASGFYGQPRMTRDIDIVAVLLPPHAPQLGEWLGSEFICDADVAKRAIAERRMFNVFHRDTPQKIDFIVRQDTDYELEKFGRRRQVTVDGQAVWMIAPEDLVLSKLVWAKASPSELQLRDVRSIIRAQRQLDWAYVERWAVRLTVAAALKEIRA